MGNFPEEREKKKDGNKWQKKFKIKLLFIYFGENNLNSDHTRALSTFYIKGKVSLPTRKHI